MTDKFERKLNDLETLIAHQTQEIGDLNDVVTAQAREIETLKKYIKIKLDKIENSLEEIGDGEHQTVADEAAANKPPHY